MSEGFNIIQRLNVQWCIESDSPPQKKPDKTMVGYSLGYRLEKKKKLCVSVQSYS